MSWKDDMEKELAIAREAERIGNAGKARTCARRAVGIALTELQKQDPTVHYGSDYLRQVRGLAEDSNILETVRSAADRLQAKLAENFSSISSRPIEDAEIIIAHIVQKLNQDLGDRSPG